MILSIIFQSHPHVDDDPEILIEFCRKSSQILVLDQISPSEVLYELKRSNNSAPGNDGITYKNLQFLDPDGLLLCHLYNRIMETDTNPNSWKTYKTTLIPKSGKNGEWYLPGDLLHFYLLVIKFLHQF